MLQRAFARTLALWVALGPMSAFATQSELVPPTSGIYTGVQFSQKIGDAFKALASCNKGSSAPANVGAATVDGQCWIDDTTSLWIDKFYVNGGWATRGAYNANDSTYLGVIGGGVPASIASASTVNLGSVPQANVTISGTTTVTGFGSAAATGISKIIRFDNALKLTYSSSLTIPGGYDLTTAANDRAIVTHLGSGNWEITQYTRASGVPIDVAAVGRPEFTFSASLPPLTVAADGSNLSRSLYPVYLAKVTRAQSGTRTSGNATISSVADTSGFGVGMPVESTGVNAGCTIASLVANTSITLNSSSCVTASGTSTVTVFLTGYGSGGNSTTVGAPNCQGRVLAGLDASSTNLSSATAFNSTQGAKTQTLITDNLPPYTPLGTIALVSGSATGTGQVGPSVTQNGSGGTSVLTSLSLTNGNANGWVLPISGSWSFTGTAQGGLSVPVTTVQPTLIAKCVVRVTP